MNFLLDTRTLLWSQQNPNKLSRTVRHHIESPLNEIFYSPINIWEIAIKYKSGKLDLGGYKPEDFLAAIEGGAYFNCLELLAGSVATSYQLPLSDHRDPFDRMLVWEALQHDMVLLSADSSLAAYKPEGLQLIT